MVRSIVGRAVLSEVPRSFEILVHDAAVEALRSGTRQAVPLEGERYWVYYGESLELVRGNTTRGKLTEQAVFATAATVVLQREGFFRQLAAYCAYNNGLKGLFIRPLGG